METMTLMLICAIVGATLGVIVGTLLGWKQVVEMLDEVDRLRKENETLKKEIGIAQETVRPQIIEINDNRAQPDNYFIPF